jgi:type I restriction enzyme S subunit
MEEKKVNVGNVPNLRFPGFEGQWQLQKLSDFIDLDSGVPLPSEDISEMSDGTPILRGINITEGKVRHNKEIDRFYPKDVDGKILKYLLEENDLVIGMDGSKVGKNVALIGEKDAGSILIQRVARIRSTIRSDIRYIFQKIYSSEFRNYVDVVNTSSGIPHISLQQIRDFQTGFPSLKEQRKIGQFLLLIDQRIETQSKIIRDFLSLLDNTSKALLLKDIQFQTNKTSECWQTKRIGDVLRIGHGKDYKHLGPGQVPVMGTGGLITYVDNFLYEGETVCIGRKGTIDKPFYLNGRIWTVDTLFYTHSFSNILPKFLYFVCRTINWKDYNEASGVPSLSKSIIENIEIEVPPVDQQFKITKILSLIEEKIEVEKELLSKLYNQKKYLLKNLFI